MKVSIINKSKNAELKEYYKYIRRYFKKTFEVLNLSQNFDVSLILVDSNKIKEINKKYRNKDKVTDVITFASLESNDDFVFDMEENIYLGDIFINVEKVFTQAKEYEHSIKREFCFLFVHGLLHCLGYDHMNKEEEKIMFDLQKNILEDLR